MTTRNDDPPHVDTPPDHVLTEVNLRLRLIEGEVWEIYCPEWKCMLYDRNLTKRVALLLSEIETHNEQTRIANL